MNVRLGVAEAFVPTALKLARPVDQGQQGALLPQADRALGGLEGALAVVPYRSAVIRMLRCKEAVVSGRLEGVQASLLDLLDQESGLTPVGSGRDVRELKALSDTLAEPWNGSATDVLLSAQLRLNAAIGIKSRGWRRSQIWVGAAGASIGEARFVPPPADRVGELMLDWEQFIRSAPSQHPLLKLSLSLAQLESIHPFQDANGRLARIFLQQQLRSEGLLSEPVLLWSDVVQRQRRQLLQVQQALRVQGDVEPWVAFFLRTLADAAGESTRLLAAVTALIESHRREISAHFGRVTPQALLILDALVARPVIGIKDVIELTGHSFPAANELTQRLVRAGMLCEITGNTRNRRFRYAPYVRAFLEDE